VYVPTLSTVGVGEFALVMVAPAGPVHKKFRLGVVEDPVNVTVVLLQLKLAGFVSTEIFGAVVLLDTVVLTDFIQPVVLSVIVSVYVPGRITIALMLLVLPDIPPAGPVHAAA